MTPGSADIAVVLASGSPRRIRMMREHGFDPIIMPADVDERVPDGLAVTRAVMYLALKKALSVEAAYAASGRRLPAVVTAADTVVCKDRIIGKPADAAEACATLESLRNTSHFVYTGVALLRVGEPVRKVFCEATRVFFRDYTRADIEAYVATGEPFDKSGGYAIQGGFARYVARVEGSTDNVTGFPWARVAEELAGIMA